MPVPFWSALACPTATALFYLTQLSVVLGGQESYTYESHIKRGLSRTYFIHLRPLSRATGSHVFTS